jgi:hypothetical protein
VKETTGGHMSDYEVVPGLWIGSEIGDLHRERQILMSKWANGDNSAKTRIKEITDQLIEIKSARKFYGKNN